MRYDWSALPDSEIPRAANPLLQHMLETYVSESNKVASTWRQFTEADLGYKPHPRSSSVREILRHQLLSERRFFGEFLGTPEPAPDKILPEPFTSLRLGLRDGGLGRCLSSTPDGSVSGFSGGGCCTLRIIELN